MGDASDQNPIGSNIRDSTDEIRSGIESVSDIPVEAGSTSDDSHLCGVNISNENKAQTKTEKLNNTGAHASKVNEIIRSIQNLNSNYERVHEAIDCEARQSFHDFQTEFHIPKTAFDGEVYSSKMKSEKEIKFNANYYKESVNTLRVCRRKRKFQSKPVLKRMTMLHNRLFMYHCPFRCFAKKLKMINRTVSEEDPRENQAHMTSSGICDKTRPTTVITKTQESNKGIANDHAMPGEAYKTRNSVDTDNTAVVSQKCEFCDNKASFSCVNCSYIYCDGCIQVLHPALGPFARHSVVPIYFSLTIQKCEDHDLPCKLFCQVCQKRRCVDCYSTSCRIHFQRNPTEDDRNKEKVGLCVNVYFISNTLTRNPRWKMHLN